MASEPLVVVSSTGWLVIEDVTNMMNVYDPTLILSDIADGETDDITAMLQLFEVIDEQTTVTEAQLISYQGTFTLWYKTGPIEG